MSNYIQQLQVDQAENIRYYKSSISNKTEQQKELERMLMAKRFSPQCIADIACGGGGLSLHLSAIFPQSKFIMIDANEESVALAQKTTEKINATCTVGDIYNLQLEDDSCDVVICWQTLSWLDKPAEALRELVRICRPGGTILASSLFNVNHDVDIYSKVIDHTRASSSLSFSYDYNTYSLRTVSKWVNGLVTDFKIHEFTIPADLTHAERGIGTYTEKLDSGERLQFSAGMLLNWGILEMNK
jgi:ubiquinone/menaquinone biosynthesis C-methylase UbiE